MLARSQSHGHTASRRSDGPAISHGLAPSSEPLQMIPSEDSRLLGDLRRQVEFYFSPFNLSNDAYLQQWIVSYSGSVPISIILGFPKIRELFSDLEAPAMHPLAEIQVLALAIGNSDSVGVSHDGQWVFSKQPWTLPRWNGGSLNSRSCMMEGPPNIQTSTKERKTILVRDLPVHCSEEAVRNAFSTATIAPKSARPDVGSTWYLAFESEAQAVEGLKASSKREIEGYPIKARLKSEFLNSSAAHNNFSEDSSQRQNQFGAERQFMNAFDGPRHQWLDGMAIPMHQDSNINVYNPNFVCSPWHAQSVALPYPVHVPMGPSGTHLTAASEMSCSPSVLLMDNPQQQMKHSVQLEARDSYGSITNLPYKNKGRVPCGTKKKLGKKHNKKNRGGSIASSTTSKESSKSERRSEKHASAKNQKEEKRDKPSPSSEGKCPTRGSHNENSNSKKRSKTRKTKQEAKHKTFEDDFPTLLPKGQRLQSQSKIAAPSIAYAQALLKPTTCDSINTSPESSSTLSHDESALTPHFEKLSVETICCEGEERCG